MKKFVRHLLDELHATYDSYRNLRDIHGVGQAGALLYMKKHRNNM